MSIQITAYFSLDFFFIVEFYEYLYILDIRSLSDFICKYFCAYDDYYLYMARVIVAQKSASSSML